MPQYARPSTDTYRGNYTDQVGGTSNIYQAIDEIVADDADFVRSPLAPASEVYVTKLSAVTDPVVHGGHVMRYRYSKDSPGGAQVDLTVQLRQDYVNEGNLGTLIKEWVHANIPDAWTASGDQTLSEGEAATISDYSNLYLRIIANQV